MIDGDKMNYKSFLFLFSFCAFAYSFDASNVVKVPGNLKMKNIAIWPLNCDQYDNCDKLQKKINLIVKKKTSFNIIPSDTVISFFGSNIPSYVDTTGLVEFVNRYQIDGILVPILIDASTVGANNGTDGDIKMMFFIPKKTKVEVKASIKLYKANSTTILAKAYGEDDSEVKDKLDEIANVIKRLVEEIF